MGQTYILIAVILYAPPLNNKIWVVKCKNSIPQTNRVGWGIFCPLLNLLWVNMDGWMDGYFVYRRSTLKGHIASNKMYII